MNARFGATSTTDDVLAGIDLRGKRAFVTGVSAGLGIETARALAAHGAHVTGAARDVDKAQVATAKVRSAASQGGGTFEIVRLDLASFVSVRDCADALVARGEPLDLVIANAGVMATPFGKTSDGFETQFGTNHRSSGPELRADCVRSVRRLWPLEDGERSLRGRIRSAPSRSRHTRDGGPSRSDRDRTRPSHGSERIRKIDR